VVQRGIFEEIPDADLGWVPVHTPLPRLSATPGGYARPAPRIGEHTWEVLKELAYDDARIRALHDAGVVGAQEKR
jgi:crotonobetainyl-CoA:carnitine CoA-transferase CaiB-like acyl-CoA transferase